MSNIHDDRIKSLGILSFARALSLQRLFESWHFHPEVQLQRLCPGVTRATLTQPVDHGRLHGEVVVFNAALITNPTSSEAYSAPELYSVRISNTIGMSHSSQGKAEVLAEWSAAKLAEEFFSDQLPLKVVATERIRGQVRVLKNEYDWMGLDVRQVFDDSPEVDDSWRRASTVVEASFAFSSLTEYVHAHLRASDLVAARESAYLASALAG